jgi:hypothetical protein
VVLKLYLIPVMPVMVDAPPVLVIAEVFAFYIGRNCVLGYIPVLDIDAHTELPSLNRNNAHSITSIGADTILFQDWITFEKGSTRTGLPKAGIMKQYTLDNKLKKPDSNGVCLWRWFFIVQCEHFVSLLKNGGSTNKRIRGRRLRSISW